MYVYIYKYFRHCPDVYKVMNETDFFDVVFDFSAYQVKKSVLVFW